MAAKLIGSFVFINQGYGILSSIYHNNITSEPYPETAKRKNMEELPLDIFAGIYNTIWLEPNTNDKTDLEITKLQDGTYELKWYNSTKKYYDGIGFLHDNKLIGTYWEV